MTTPGMMKLRSSSISTSTSSLRSVTPDYSSLNSIKSYIGRKSDPIVQVYLPLEANQQWRNFIFRAMIYFSTTSSRTNPDIAPEEIGAIDTIEPTNHNELHPFSLRFANAKVVHQFLCYVIDHWNFDDTNVIMFMNVEKAGFAAICRHEP